MSALNPNWRDPKPDERQGFEKALALAGKEFQDRVHHYATDWWEAFSCVKSALDNRFEVSNLFQLCDRLNNSTLYK